MTPVLNLSRFDDVHVRDHYDYDDDLDLDMSDYYYFSIYRHLELKSAVHDHVPNLIRSFYYDAESAADVNDDEVDLDQHLYPFRDI